MPEIVTGYTAEAVAICKTDLLFVISSSIGLFKTNIC